MNTGIRAFFYVLSCLVILGNIWVSRSMIRIGLLTAQSKLIFYLHLTMILENISSFPDAYTSNKALCAFVGFLKTYSMLANAFIMAHLILLYRYLFIEDSWLILRTLSRHREIWIFGVSLISLLPLFSRSYGIFEHDFCTIESRRNSVNLAWRIILFGFVMMGTTVFMFGSLIHTILVVFVNEKHYLSSLIRSAGIYGFLSISSFVPRCLAQLGVVPYDETFFLTYITGMLYLLLFLYEKEKIAAYELSSQNNPNLRDFDEQGSIYQSWGGSPFSSTQSSKELLESAQAADRNSIQANRKSLSFRDSLLGVTSPSSPTNNTRAGKVKSLRLAILGANREDEVTAESPPSNNVIIQSPIASENI
jgi:hypothetical protein